MNLPSHLRYTATHEWAHVGDDGLVWVGITDFGQEALGDLVFVGDVKIGAKLAAGDVSGVVESVKAASDIHAPVDGEVVAFNDALTDAPEKVNEAPYGDGWIFEVRVSDPATIEGLMDATAYEGQLS